MAPTVQNGVEQSRSAIFDSKAARHQTSYAGSSQRAYDLHRLRSTSKLWRHQNRAEIALPTNADTARSSEPYESPIPLHAKIVPNADITSHSNTFLFGHLSITEFILVSSAALMVVLVGVVALVMMRSIILKKVRRLLRCGCSRRQANNKAMTDDKGALVMGNESDDLTWGTPLRFVYVEGPDDRLKERQSILPNDPPSSPLAVTPLVPFASTSPRLPAACEDNSFQGRLEYEEHDITLALTRALRDDPDPDANSVCSVASGDKRFSALRYLENSSMLDSLQASIDDLAHGILSSNRPRQCSDASTSSQTTTAARSDSTDFFPTQSPDYSMTSLDSTDSSFDGPEELEEEVYEVRRAHAKSLELKKGVLVTCKRTPTGDIANPDMLPTFVISEAPPNLMPLDDLNFAPLFSLSNSMSSKASLSGCTTTPSWSSIVRENSRGTMASLSSSSSTTAMDGWIRGNEQHLHPPVPFLMLTRPSDSSILTAGSSTSSVSIDLCDFPLPPIPAKPSYYSKLVGQVQRAPKRIWDNHPADSTVAQKRFTVERFIKMYSGA